MLLEMTLLISNCSKMLSVPQFIGCCEYKFSFFANNQVSPNRTISVTQFISRIMLGTSSRLVSISFMIIKIITYKQRKIFKNNLFNTILFSNSIKIVSWTEPTKPSIVITIISSSSSIFSGIEIINILDLF